MNKYKVEFIQTETFIVDVKAKDEEQAREKARVGFDDRTDSGMLHYHQIGDTEVEFGTVYDVTDTDDPFDEV